MDMTDRPAAPASPSPRRTPGLTEPMVPRRLRSEDLLVGEVEVEIVHGETLYRLRHTASGKLILTK